jgi:hypothetical protein
MCGTSAALADAAPDLPGSNVAVEAAAALEFHLLPTRTAETIDLAWADAQADAEAIGYSAPTSIAAATALDALLQDNAAAQTPATSPASAESPHHLRTWELPAVTVVGEAPAALKEEERVGSYAQPRWTATRRFPTTRVYVIPEGKVETEFWARGTFGRDDVDEWRFLQELEIGLPGRFQLDLYLRQDYDTESDDTLWGGQFEVRWAFADWGKIWGNPTLYFEYITLDQRPDKIEPKLLLGGELAERWHWALNFVMEWELSGPDLEHEYQVTSALSYTLVDSKFSIGVEDIFTFVDTREDRGTFETSFVIGPDFQWHPVPPMTINVAPLIGIGHDSPEVQLWVNIGWEF